MESPLKLLLSYLEITRATFSPWQLNWIKANTPTYFDIQQAPLIRPLLVTDQLCCRVQRSGSNELQSSIRENLGDSRRHGSLRVPGVAIAFRCQKADDHARSDEYSTKADIVIELGERKDGIDEIKRDWLLTIYRMSPETAASPHLKSGRSQRSLLSSGQPRQHRHDARRVEQILTAKIGKFTHPGRAAR